MPRSRRASLILGLAIVSTLAGCAGPAAPTAADTSDAEASAVPPAASPPPSGSRFPTTIPVLTGSSPAAPAPSPVPPYTFITTMQGNAFEHARLDISPGATIVWQNLDLATHSVIGEPGGFVGSGPIASGSSFSQTFERAGEYAFHCRYHAGMTGLVVVA